MMTTTMSKIYQVSFNFIMPEYEGTEDNAHTAFVVAESYDDAVRNVTANFTKEFERIEIYGISTPKNVHIL